MMGQTISLFRFLLLGVLNLRLFVLVTILLAAALLLSSFITELAIVNSEKIAAALMADLLRYSLVFLTILLITTSVAQDFEFKQFERLLTMPISRWQYIAAQILAIVTIASVLVLPVLPVVGFNAGFDIAVYWTIGLWFEILLVGVLALVAILALEKIPPAIFFTLAVYLLAKLSGLISQILTESVKHSDGAAANRFADLVFNGILHLVPRLEAFAQNDVFFNESQEFSTLLLGQLATVAIYIAFLIVVSLFDFYRKEFNI
jgi:ABC-type transport system involved in multi-copper enzyme maturation permease subunit